jgi:hypothetical protein
VVINDHFTEVLIFLDLAFWQCGCAKRYTFGILEFKLEFVTVEINIINNVPAGADGVAIKCFGTKSICFFRGQESVAGIYKSQAVAETF